LYIPVVVVCHEKSVPEEVALRCATESFKAAVARRCEAKWF
jgi:hypothetical protein